MIEQALYNHLITQASLLPYLATYNGQPAVFNQEAPADTDELWGSGPQYARIVFAVDIQGDPERTMGGTLAVDIMCKKFVIPEEDVEPSEDDTEQFPEDIEPIVRPLIHGYFFSNGMFVVAAQWKNSSYFTEATDHIAGCTITFDLLAFPVLTTANPDVVARINAWTTTHFEDLHVINLDELPSEAWKPTGSASAVYWRLAQDAPAGWIPDTFQTIWRTATLKCHIFSQDISTASTVAQKLTTKLYAVKRLLKPEETPIMVNRRNTTEYGSDPLRTGQLTVEATYGIIVHEESRSAINHVNY